MWKTYKSKFMKYLIKIAWPNKGSNCANRKDATQYTSQSVVFSMEIGLVVGVLGIV